MKPFHLGGSIAIFLLLVSFVPAGLACAQEAPEMPRRGAIFLRGRQDFYFGTFSTGEDPPRYLYPIQEELENQLSGTPEERRRIAALLPLQLAYRPGAFVTVGDHYQFGILRTIVREKWREALPLLAWGVQSTNPWETHISSRSFFQRRRQSQAAAVWLWLATLDMDLDSELEFILGILKGEEPSVETGMLRPLADAIDRQTNSLLGDAGRRNKIPNVLYEYLSEGDATLKSVDDLERAMLVGRIVGKYVLPIRRLPAIEEDLSQISRHDSLFNQVVVAQAIRHLASPGDHPGIVQGPRVRSDRLDAMFGEVGEKMWNERLEDRALEARIRLDVSGYTIERLFPYLRELNEHPEPYAPEPNITHAIERILSSLETRHTREGPLPDEVIAYLRSMAADPRYGPSAMRMTPEKSLAVHLDEVRNIYLIYTRAGAVIERILAHEGN